MERKEHNEAASKYEDLFLLFTKRVEKVLTVVLLMLMFALVVSQLLLQHPQIRYLLVRVERLEGNPYSATSTPVSYQMGG